MEKLLCNLFSYTFTTKLERYSFNTIQCFFRIHIDDNVFRFHTHSPIWATLVSVNDAFI